MRASYIGFMFLCLCLGMSIMNEFASAYQYGYFQGYHNVTYAGTNREITAKRYSPGAGFGAVDQFGQTINGSNFDEYNSSMQGVIEYAPQQDEGNFITDLSGFVQYSIAGVRIIINTILMPLYGFPRMLMDFSLPSFISYSISIVLTITVLLGLVSWITGKHL